MNLSSLKYLFIFLTVSLFAASCDNIGEDDRYIKVEDVMHQRRVLLEEFTGQRCTNCPAAHAIIEKLEEQYGQDLVVVSIHAGSFGIAAPGGLMQPEGNEYASHWKISAYPAGVVDRTGEALTSDSWAAAIRNDIAKETPVEIKLDASIDDNSIISSTLITSSEKIEGKLQLWVVENGIVGFQIDGSDRLQDYVHNNVFRACINGVWGQPVTLGPDFNVTSENSIEIDPAWNVDNLFVVGFVYNDSGVVQVVKSKVRK